MPRTLVTGATGFIGSHLTRLHVQRGDELNASRERTFSLNVEGTRIVLEEALRAGVERAVYTSSVVAIGLRGRASRRTKRAPGKPAATRSRTSAPSTRRRSPRSG